MRSTISTVLLRGSLLCGVLALGACPSSPTAADLGTTPDLAMPAPAPDMAFTGPVLRGPSKSGTAAISDDDAVVALVNQDNGSVSFFSTTNNIKLSTVNTGGAPSAVVIAPDNTTAYVANRASATVVKITGIGTAAPTVGIPTNVGSEPTGLALSPTGAKLYVAEFAESSIGVIDTTTMTRTTFVTKVRNPRAVSVTNNGDRSDSDETVVVPEFFGITQNAEGSNKGRQGLVHLYKVTDGTEQSPILFSPFTNTVATFELTTSPNQLYAAAIANGRVFVPSVSSSPAAPLGADKNVYPVVYVGDLASRSPVVGSTINLAEPINAFAQPRWFLADLADIAFVPTSNIAYLVSRGADVVQRVDFGQTPPTAGSVQSRQIDILGAGTSSCQNPTGIAIARTLNKAYVNCWVTRRLAVLDLTTQTVSTVVDSITPSGTTTAIDRGRRFFYTGRGRWSGDGSGTTEPTENGSAWSSCGSCHPDGLSDNITWIFGSGPRQTTSMDGTFSHGGGTQKMRILNWSAINDELHDFENNTRGTSGGKGAITTAATSCGTLPTETRAVIPAAGLDNQAGRVVKEIQDNQANNCVKDFDDITEFVKTITPPKGRRFLDQASVARGATLFGATQAGCAKCHGGAGWTISNRFYAPSGATNNATTGITSLRTTTFNAPTQYMSFASPNGFQIGAQALTADATVTVAIPPLQLSCALRNVSTFGFPGDTAKTDALEIRNNTFANGVGTSNRAQGKGGYNVPALYGLQLGAPYLHHGQALTLEELFTDVKWQTHWQAGNANFLSGGTAAQDRIDIINFLLSLDSTTAEQPVPAGFAGGCTCPNGAIAC